jgi:hypothetical protein
MTLKKILNMKKILLIAIVNFFIITSNSAQKFSISNDSVTFNNGDTIYVNVDASAYVIKDTELDVTNDTLIALSIKVKRYAISIVTEASESFCFSGSCYFADSSDAETINPLSDTVFSTHFYSDTSSRGISIVAYTFFENNNRNDSVMVIFKYSGLHVGIKEHVITNRVQTSKIYPNPANQYTNIKYSLSDDISSARLVVYNLLGSVVKEYIINVNSSIGELSINTSDLENGMYYYSFIADDKIYLTKKLVVAH